MCFATGVIRLDHAHNHGLLYLCPAGVHRVVSKRVSTTGSFLSTHTHRLIETDLCTPTRIADCTDTMASTVKSMIGMQTDHVETLAKLAAYTSHTIMHGAQECMLVD